MSYGIIHVSHPIKKTIDFDLLQVAQKVAIKKDGRVVGYRHTTEPTKIPKIPGEPGTKNSWKRKCLITKEQIKQIEEFAEPLIKSGVFYIEIFEKIDKKLITDHNGKELTVNVFEGYMRKLKTKILDSGGEIVKRSEAQFAVEKMLEQNFSRSEIHKKIHVSESYLRNCISRYKRKKNIITGYVWLNPKL